MATLSASTQKKVDPSNPVLKAMTTFTDSEDLQEVLEAFVRTNSILVFYFLFSILLENIEGRGGRGRSLLGYTLHSE